MSLYSKRTLKESSTSGPSSWAQALGAIISSVRFSLNGMKSNHYTSVTLTRIVVYHWLVFQFSDFRSQVSDFRFHNSDFRFQISEFRFQVLDFRFQVSEFRSQTSESHFWDLGPGEPLWGYWGNPAGLPIAPVY